MVMIWKCWKKSCKIALIRRFYVNSCNFQLGCTIWFQPDSSVAEQGIHKCWPTSGLKACKVSIHVDPPSPCGWQNFGTVRHLKTLFLCPASFSTIIVVMTKYYSTGDSTRTERIMVTKCHFGTNTFYLAPPPWPPPPVLNFFPPRKLSCIPWPEFQLAFSLVAFETGTIHHLLHDSPATKTIFSISCLRQSHEVFGWSKRLS